jgi:hypothetical protein
MSCTTLSRLLENRVTYATLLVLFALAICVNIMAGGSVPAFGVNPALLPGGDPVQNAEANQTHTAAISPLPPPNPWDDAARKLAISPLPPPNPWDDNKSTRAAISPLPPPNPWDDAARKRDKRPHQPPQQT